MYQLRRDDKSSDQSFIQDPTSKNICGTTESLLPRCTKKRFDAKVECTASSGRSRGAPMIRWSRHLHKRRSTRGYTKNRAKVAPKNVLPKNFMLVSCSDIERGPRCERAFPSAPSLARESSDFLSPRRGRSICISSRARSRFQGVVF